MNDYLRTLLVSNISPQTTEDEFRSVFESFGIASLRLTTIVSTQSGDASELAGTKKGSILFNTEAGAIAALSSSPPKDSGGYRWHFRRPHEGELIHSRLAGARGMLDSTLTTSSFLNTQQEDFFTFTGSGDETSSCGSRHGPPQRESFAEETDSVYNPLTSSFFRPTDSRTISSPHSNNSSFPQSFGLPGPSSFAGLPQPQQPVPLVPSEQGSVSTQQLTPCTPTILPGKETVVIERVTTIENGQPVTVYMLPPADQFPAVYLQRSSQPGGAAQLIGATPGASGAPLPNQITLTGALLCQQHQTPQLPFTQSLPHPLQSPSQYPQPLTASFGHRASFTQSSFSYSAPPQDSPPTCLPATPIGMVSDTGSGNSGCVFPKHQPTSAVRSPAPFPNAFPLDPHLCRYR